jgi:hypothetical protein
MGRVVDPTHGELLEHQAFALVEHLLALLVALDVADHHRAGLPARNRCVGGVLEPVALAQAIDHAALEVADVTGHALDLRVLDGLDHDLVAQPVVGETADLLGRSGYGGQEARGNH